MRPLEFDAAQWVIDFAMQPSTPPDPQLTSSTQSAFSTPPPTSRISRSRAAATPVTPAEPSTSRKRRIRWTTEIEEAMLKGLVKKIALNRTLAVAQQPVTLKQVKGKHDSQKREWKV
ncbi:hypothetical protein AOQ84DRAFT_393626 [Glonium stellatum]|uniref:Uncharacterized protein n=1 Tax=Glonium stellatum TaxID=574774 RepID=A0A8E2JLG8_9PEZI|nr:hypothetical protein AOQ84DRAFT_393626 [Glonium stellatum]